MESSSSSYTIEDYFNDEKLKKLISEVVDKFFEKIKDIPSIPDKEREEQKFWLLNEILNQRKFGERDWGSTVGSDGKWTVVIPMFPINFDLLFRYSCYEEIPSLKKVLSGKKETKTQKLDQKVKPAPLYPMSTRNASQNKDDFMKLLNEGDEPKEKKFSIHPKIRYTPVFQCIERLEVRCYGSLYPSLRGTCIQEIYNRLGIPVKIITEREW
jgi:hypothetical protein